MNKDRTMEWTSFGVTVLAGAGCFLAALMTAEFSWLDWALAENLYRGTEFGLNRTVTTGLIIAFALGLLALAGLIFCIVHCFRQKTYVQIGEEWAAEPAGLCWFDKVFGEVQLVVGILAGCLFVPAFIVLRNWFFYSRWVGESIISKAGGEEYSVVREALRDYYPTSKFLTPNIVSLFVALIFAMVAIGLCTQVLLSFTRKIRNRCFWRNTLIGLIACKIMQVIEHDDKIYRKVFIVVICGVLLSMTWVGAAAVIVLAIIFLPKYLNQYKAIREGAAEIKDGNLGWQIPVESDGELAALAKDINEISNAQHAAITKELKTQRLRTDLITNVSHDLKTPLTSMVTYVDLLKKEGLDAERAPEYLDVLDEKTQRLKKLSEDLFEAAKASSGDIPVDAERIDMEAMIGQALAELESNLAASDIDVIVTKKTEDVHVMADGRHLWRIIENLLVNISKYAMPGTRSYIDLSERDAFLRMEVKNMSAGQLNIDADELMERFQRGDESRTTEGSGLGLSIARDLTHVMGGRFTLTIDGDLFKVTVDLPRA